MSHLCKLTDAEGYTRRGEKNQLQWGEGVTHSARGTGTILCSDGFIHAYEHPLIASFMNPVHADIEAPLCWEVEGDVVLREGQLKCGLKTCTTVKRTPLPVITTEQRVEIAIRWRGQRPLRSPNSLRTSNGGSTNPSRGQKKLKR